MGRANPTKIVICEEDKRSLFNLIKKLTVSNSKKAKKDLLKLALKFPPGEGPVYLHVWERQVIVSWLLKLHNLAMVREEKILTEKFRKMIEVFR